MTPSGLGRAFLEELAELPLLLVRNMPGRIGLLLRRLYWGQRLRHLGRKVVFGRNVHIYHPRWVSIGDTCWIDDDVTLIAGPPGRERRMKRIADHGLDEGSLEIGPRCHVAVGVVIQAHGGVRVGAETGLASGSRVYSLSHHYRNIDDPEDRTRYIFSPCVEPERQLLLVGPVVLGEGTALGLNAVVLPGTFLGDFSWVATGAIFSGEAPEGVILAGNPAVVIKKRPGFD